MNDTAKTMVMKGEFPLAFLQKEWIDFLQSRGHRVEEPEDIMGVVVSESKKDNRFRWLLFTARGLIKRLTPGEYQNLSKEVERAKKAGQKPYVVVYFSVLESKIVIKPAGRVLKTGRVGSVRGGIAWSG